MFDIFKKKKEIVAPLSGESVPLEKVPDEAFSQKMIGDGISIIPSDGHLVSLFDGMVVRVFDTKHAYVLKSDDGIEVLIHIGIDTVKLNGEGFDNRVSNGQKVKKGDLLSIIDFDFISKQGLPIFTPVIFTNMDQFNMKFNFGSLTRGETPISYY